MTSAAQSDTRLFPTPAISPSSDAGAMHTGGAAVVESLLAHAVDTVFGIPGTHNLEIYRHLAQSGRSHRDDPP